MGILGRPQPIESTGHILRARRMAVASRASVGIAGLLVILARPGLVERPALGMAGFLMLLLGGAVQAWAPRPGLLAVEESLSAAAAVLVVGLQGQTVNVIDLLWLVAVASGVLARGGRVHWIGRTVLLCALALPVLREGSLAAPYAAMCVGTIALLLTAGRLTRELNTLLREARQQADSAEALLLAGDIAARMSERGGPRRAGEAPARALGEEEISRARNGLARIVRGEGLKVVVQPIVDVRTGGIHAFEALARFGEDAAGATPLHWFALADELGCRPALERTCLGQALALLGVRPAGTSLSVNVSVPVLLEEETLRLLEHAAEGRQERLEGLIVEITEETLVDTGADLHAAIGPLLACGARLAVDDVGAGYSGLRQITTVRPSYLKLDRALASGIDRDPELAALVGALVGYAEQVGSLLVAEGIETTDELRALQRIGVPLVQGFRLSRPGEPWPSVDSGDAASQDAPARRAAGPARALEPVFLDPEDWVELERQHLRRGLARA